MHASWQERAIKNITTFTKLVVMRTKSANNTYYNMLSYLFFMTLNYDGWPCLMLFNHIHLNVVLVLFIQQLAGKWNGK